MKIANKIRFLVIERDVKMKDVADKFGSTPSNWANKLKNDNFRVNELERIAEILDCDLEVNFVLRDSGKKI